MKRACYITVQYVVLTLFFSIGYIYNAAVPAYERPTESSPVNRMTSKQAVPTVNISDDVEGLEKKHSELHPEKLWREECDDGEGDDEDVEDCIEDCREERNEALVEAALAVAGAILTCYVCFSGGGPACVACVITSLASVIAVRNTLDDYQDCKEDCIST